MNLDYGAAKAAMLNLTKGLSEEFGAAGVRVNTVSPGPTLTPWWTDAGGAADIVAGWADTDAGSVVSTLAPAQMQLTTGRFVDAAGDRRRGRAAVLPALGEHDRRRVGRRRRDAQGAVAASITLRPAGEPVGTIRVTVEAGGSQQRAELGLHALAGPEQQQHVQVHPDRAGEVLGALREDRVDDEHAPVRRQRLAHDLRMRRAGSSSQSCRMRESR